MLDNCLAWRAAPSNIFLRQKGCKSCQVIPVTPHPWQLPQSRQKRTAQEIEPSFRSLGPVLDTNSWIEWARCAAPTR